VPKTKRIHEGNSNDPRFYGDWKLELVEAGGLEFWVRPGTSDEKSIKDVVTRKAYDRYKIGPKEGELWMDIGANIGAFSVLAASRGVSVQAFEPDPVSLRIAKINVKHNGLDARVRFDPRAVVGQMPAEPLQLHVNSARQNFWRNSLYHEWRGGFSIPVECVTLDEFLDPWDAGSYNIKLDAEGAEMELIERSEHLDRWGRLVTEWSFDIDRSIARFRAAIAKLEAVYTEVKYGKFDETFDEWQPSWFPPTRMLYCQ
jgi:FkbM family methyltransferase